MRLENVLALTHAKLINKPIVNNFENIVFEARYIKRGDLFLAFHDEEIESAIANGAYGIIFSKPVQMSDSEIAWMQVQNIEDALKRLLRFRLIEKKVTTYTCDAITQKLALQIITEPNFIVLKSDLQDISKMLWDIEEKSTLLFCPDLCSSDIFTDIKELPKEISERINIVEKTLFESSFIYKDIFHERQFISAFFIPYLEKLLQLFETLQVNYRLRKFAAIEHFQAVFINKNLEIKEFGASDKVLIFEKNSEYVLEEMEFLEKNAPWAKIIMILPMGSTINSKESHKIYHYRDEKEIFALLKKHEFHFALIAGVDKSILISAHEAPKQLTLEF